MSHTTQVETKMTQKASLEAACRAIGAEFSEGTARLFDGTTAEGYVLKLPGWRQPVIIDKRTGEAKMDTYNGHWGSMDVFNKLRQNYSVAESTAQLRKRGYRVSQRNVNGKIVVSASR